MRRIVTMSGASGHATALRADSPRPDNFPQASPMGEVPARVHALGPSHRAALSSTSRREDWSAFVVDGDRSGVAGVPRRSVPSVITAARKASPREPIEPQLAARRSQSHSSSGNRNETALEKPREFVEVDGVMIQRPRTRAECRDEARPCPWVSCRHHLLLEVASPRNGRDPRATSIRINERKDGEIGRRRGIASSSAGLLVEQWIDDAVERLSSMRATCSLDITEQHPEGIQDRQVGRYLGVAKQRIEVERKQPHIAAALEQLRGHL